MFRKNLHAYSKGLKGASEFRSKVNVITEPILMREAISEFFKKRNLKAKNMGFKS